MKKHLWGIICAALITAATTFTMLDAFVIERNIAVEPISMFQPVEYEGGTLPTLPPPPSEPTSEPTSVSVAETTSEPETTSVTEPSTGSVTTARSASPTAPTTRTPPAPPPPPQSHWSHRDSHISIEINRHEGYGTVYYVAEIKLSSPSYLRTALAQNRYGRNITESVPRMASNNGAIFAISGDYYGFRDCGLVIRNGMLYRNELSTRNSTESLLIDRHGDFSLVRNGVITDDELAEREAMHGLTFGPTLVRGGVNTVTHLDDKFDPRTAIGQVGNLHYIIVVSEGRIGSSPQQAGLSISDLADIFVNHGCHTAYNLDGGGTTHMWFNGRTIYSNTNRAISDIIYIPRSL
jgi:exopolysaccharide biosynthesis protein